MKEKLQPTDKLNRFSLLFLKARIIGVVVLLVLLVILYVLTK